MHAPCRRCGANALCAAMRITCPACAATYEVPDRLIGPEGRRLRCARCGEQWTAERPEAGAADAQAPEPRAAAVQAPETAPPPPPPMEAPPPPPRRAPAPRPGPASRRPPQLIDPPLPPIGDAPRRGGGPALWLAWAATVLAVLGFAAAVVTFRQEIVAAWPPAARLYLALGL